MKINPSFLNFSSPKQMKDVSDICVSVLEKYADNSKVHKLYDSVLSVCPEDLILCCLSVCPRCSNPVLSVSVCSDAPILCFQSVCAQMLKSCVASQCVLRCSNPVLSVSVCSDAPILCCQSVCVQML